MLICVVAVEAQLLSFRVALWWHAMMAMMAGPRTLTPMVVVPSPHSGRCSPFPALVRPFTSQSDWVEPLMW